MSIRPAGGIERVYNDQHKFYFLPGRQDSEAFPQWYTPYKSRGVGGNKLLDMFLALAPNSFFGQADFEMYPLPYRPWSFWYDRSGVCDIASAQLIDHIDWWFSGGHAAASNYVFWLQLSCFAPDCPLMTILNTTLYALKNRTEHAQKIFNRVKVVAIFTEQDNSCYNTNKYNIPMVLGESWFWLHATTQKKGWSSNRVCAEENVTTPWLVCPKNNYPGYDGSRLTNTTGPGGFMVIPLGASITRGFNDIYKFLFKEDMHKYYARAKRSNMFVAFADWYHDRNIVRAQLVYNMNTGKLTDCTKTTDKNTANWHEKNRSFSYYKHLVTHRFVASPRGHGVDCWRHWESLAMGSIPILRNIAMHEAMEGLPALFIEDSYLSVTDEMLAAAYQMMQNYTWHYYRLTPRYWYSRLLHPNYANDL